MKSANPEHHSVSAVERKDLIPTSTVTASSSNLKLYEAICDVSVSEKVGATINVGEARAKLKMYVGRIFSSSWFIQISTMPKHRTRILSDR